MSTGKPSLDESLTNIQWLCNLESAEIFTADKGKKEEWKYQEPASTNPFTKPPYSYATLILMAINSSEAKRMTLQDIYKWIEANYPFYKTCKKAWKNSIRHNLSLYNFFIKEKRPSNLPGKGSYWSISAEGKENMMKEVLKHQQPVINSLEYLQGRSKGLRPILPKPCGASSEGSQTNGVQLVGDGSVPGLPRGVPIVILPTHLYISMANKLAAQAANGDGSAIGIRPEQFVSSVEASAHSGSQSATSSTDNFDARPTMAEIEGGSLSVDGTTTCSRSNGDDSDSLQLSYHEEFALPTLVLPESLKDRVTCASSNPNPLTSPGFDSGIDCSPAVSEIDSSTNYIDCTAQKKQKGRTFGEPTPKRVKQQRKKPVIKSHSTMPSGRPIRTPSKRSPLREHSHPTLAAINSNSNIMVSPTSILKTLGASLLGNDLSPLQATPTKDNRNPLTSEGFLSPSTSAALGCNYPQAFTPLKFDSDSGLFTPFADGGFDCGFLVSPSRYSSILTPSKLRSTPQGCRKSLRLGVVREEGQGSDCLDWFQL